MKQYKTSAALTQYYKLPDGQMIDVSSEKIQSVEPLFAPSTLMSADDTVASQLPIHRLVHNAIARLGMTGHFLSHYPALTYPPLPSLCYLTLSYPALPYPTTPCPALPYPTAPYPMLSNLTLPYLALSCLVLSPN